VCEHLHGQENIDLLLSALPNVLAGDRPAANVAAGRRFDFNQLGLCAGDAFLGGLIGLTSALRPVQRVVEEQLGRLQGFPKSEVVNRRYLAKNLRIASE
jgi:hypothetical protein